MKQRINLGTPPKGDDGDTSKVAFTKCNANFDELYNRLQARLEKNLSAAGALVNLTAEEALRGVIVLSGALTANVEVTVPADPSQAWIVVNATTGAFTVKFRTQGGTGPTVARGDSALLFSDGVNVVDVRASMATKAYVDAADALKADKTYVDTGLAAKMPANPGGGPGTVVLGDGTRSNILKSSFQVQSANYPGVEFHAPGATAVYQYIDYSTGNLLIQNSNGAFGATGVARMVITNVGNVSISGTLVQGSDRRIKSNIQTIPDALARVREIRGVTYQRIVPPGGVNDATDHFAVVLGAPEMGVVAQEVQQVCPELVSVPDPKTGILAVSYGNMVGLLLQAINELADAHDAAVARIAALESA